MIGDYVRALRRVVNWLGICGLIVWGLYWLATRG